MTQKYVASTRVGKNSGVFGPERERLQKPRIIKQRFASQNIYLSILISMNQKSVEKVSSSKNTKQPYLSFNELSISSIREKNISDQSFDFSQQKLMLNQIDAGLADTNDQYGLHKHIATRCFAKKQKPDRPMQLIRGTSLSRLHNFQNSQNLCFNKDIRRKKTNSKSKEKLFNSPSLLTTCCSLKQLRSSGNVQFSNRKIRQSRMQTTGVNQKPHIDVKAISRAPQIALKIYEEPLGNVYAKDENKTFMGFYHHLPDDYKIQLNDLTNWHKEFEFILKREDETMRASTETQSRSAKRKQAKSLIAIDLKRSSLSKPEDKSSSQQSDSLKKAIKKSEIYQSNQTKQVVEVSKPLSLDWKNSSFYSSRTEDYESPISKDSGSTATRRIMKRSELCKTPQEYGYGYFEASGQSKNARK